MYSDSSTHKNNQRFAKALVFGVFDGLHDGHRYFLQQAAQLTEQLHIAVTHDIIVKRLKKRTPKFMIDERIAALDALDIVHHVHTGDTTLRQWNSIHLIQPNVIILGHDQQALAAALENDRNLFPSVQEIVTLASHQPEHFNSTHLFHS